MPVTRSSDGVELHFDVTGNGQTGLLFLHGWGGAGSGSSWRQMLPHLDLTGRRAVLMDWRGHGRSASPPDGYTIPQMGADALAVADAACLDRLVLVAFSMGGKVAQWIACHHPDRVAAQFLMAPLVLGPMLLNSQELASWMNIARHADRFGEILAAREDPPVPAEVMQSFLRDCASVPQTSLEAAYWMCATGAGPEHLGATRAATLIAVGDRDNHSPPERVRTEVAGRIPGARLVTLKAGHHLPLIRGREMALLLGEFLGGAVP